MCTVACIKIVSLRNDALSVGKNKKVCYLRRCFTLNRIVQDSCFSSCASIRRNNAETIANAQMHNKPHRRGEESPCTHLLLSSILLGRCSHPR